MDSIVPQGYKNTKVGVIPEGWEVVEVGEVFDFIKTSFIFLITVLFIKELNIIFSVMKRNILKKALKPIFLNGIILKLEI